MNDERLAAARAWLAENANRRRQQVAEFAITRPTPTQDENDRAADGDLTMLKRWDLSPVDPASFDATEPPGRPEEPRHHRS
jgi:hypothetical protein